MVDLLGLMNLVDFSIVSAAIGVIAGVVNSILASRRAERQRQTEIETRQVQFCWQALERVHNKEFMRRVIEIMYHMDFKDYEEWLEKYGPITNPDAYVDYYQVTSTNQGLGYLVQNGVIEPEALSKYIRPRGIISLWEKIEPIVKVHRERYNSTAYDSFEYLANEMRALLDQRMAQVSTDAE
jgi:hypothetical protein